MQRLVVLSVAIAVAACNPGRRTPPVDIGTELQGQVKPHGPSADPDRAAAVQELLENFRRVHFATDSSSLAEEAKVALTANAKILQAHTDLEVEVQGHADERGTVDYNLALGQRRARTVTGWIQAHGVPESRLHTITYGEELPLVAGNDERAWSKNRRAEFRITAGGRSVIGTTE